MRFAPRHNGRTAFTLTELLVVVSIIAVIMSLSIGAIFGLRESQMKNFSEATVQKLASALDQQWKATMDQIYDETPAPWAVNLSTSSTTRSPDLRRTRALYIKGRLRQEFPINFAQAIPDPQSPVITGSNPPKRQAFNPFFLSISDGVPLKATYAQSLQDAAGNYFVIPNPEPDWTSSAMLFLTLSQGRRGQAAFDPASLVEPSAIQSRTLNGKTFQIFVDGWGNPLRFFVFPTGNDEINADPYVKPLTANPYASYDVQDPEDTLMSPAWFATFRNDFKAKIHDLPPPSNPPFPIAARHLLPVVASAGKDGQWGIDLTTMRIIPSQADQQQDNIYSYRLRRVGARGD
jgi:prepilin-type N-terminal cleavage/methylation domain-containing protein